MDYKARVKKYRSSEAAQSYVEDVTTEEHEQKVRDRFARMQEIIWQIVRPEFEKMREAVVENGCKATITESKGGPEGEDPIYVTSISIVIEGPPNGRISYDWEGYRFKVTTVKNTDIEETHVGLDALDRSVVEGHCDALVAKMFPTR